jgi:hypothetical protein
MSDTKETRRQYPRFHVDIQVSVFVADRELGARTRDISRAGLCLVTVEAIPGETEIAVELVLTFGEGGISEPLHLPGKVVWCTSLFGAYQVGVKFLNIDEDQARYLRMFIGFLDGSISTDHDYPSDDTDDDPTPARRTDPDDPFRF